MQEKTEGKIETKKESKFKKGIRKIFGRKKEVTPLFEEGKFSKPIPKQQEELDTKLRNAVWDGKRKEVEQLIKLGADVNYELKNRKWKGGIWFSKGSTLLMISAGFGNSEICELLLQNGADVNLCDKYGWTALMFAATNGRADICKLLIENGADINAKKNDGETALILASWKGPLNVVKYLLSVGANPFIKSNKGKTAYDVTNIGFDGIRNIIKIYEKMWKAVEEKRTLEMILAVRNCEPNIVKEIFEKL